MTPDRDDIAAAVEVAQSIASEYLARAHRHEPEQAALDRAAASGAAHVRDKLALLARPVDATPDPT